MEQQKNIIQENSKKITTIILIFFLVFNLVIIVKDKLLHSVEYSNSFVFFVVSLLGFYLGIKITIKKKMKNMFLQCSIPIIMYYVFYFLCILILMLGALILFLTQ